jgi:hypothetical protein
MKNIAALGITFSLALNSLVPGATHVLGNNHQTLKVNETKLDDWLRRWERNILNENAMQYCSEEAGEEIGWKMSPFLKGFYSGYLATGNALWIDRLIACTDAWLKRATIEPDGYLGWPKVGAAGTEVDDLDSFYADSMLGEAMALTPIVLMAVEIKTTSSAEKYRSKAEAYINFAEQVFKKWDSRGAWRETGTSGVITVVLPFGIDQATRRWTGEYDRRTVPQLGFSHPDNKANLIAVWLLAMFDATGKAVYRERAEEWFQAMKSRMKLGSNGTYEIWNYWEPAGVWDYKSSGPPKHWIGVHPKAGYYEIDVAAIVAAYEHRLVFNEEDINRLVKTAITDMRYWIALVPFDDTIREHFESSVDPSSWDGITRVPWYAAIQRNGHRRKQAPW